MLECLPQKNLMTNAGSTFDIRIDRLLEPNIVEVGGSLAKFHLMSKLTKKAFNKIRHGLLESCGPSRRYKTADKCNHRLNYGPVFEGRFLYLGMH